MRWSQTLDVCINNSAVSRYVLTNNTSGTVYYHVEYFIQGSSSWVTVDTDLTLGAAGSNTQSAEFTQNVDTGKSIAPDVVLKGTVSRLSNVGPTLAPTVSNNLNTTLEILFTLP